MKCTIRYNTFETNSSSSHALAYLSSSDWYNWRYQGYFLDMRRTYYVTSIDGNAYDEGAVISPEECQKVIDYLNDMDLGDQYSFDNISEQGIYTYDQVMDWLANSDTQHYGNIYSINIQKSPFSYDDEAGMIIIDLEIRLH